MGRMNHLTFARKKVENLKVRKMKNVIRLKSLISNIGIFSIARINKGQDWKMLSIKVEEGDRLEPSDGEKNRDKFEFGIYWDSFGI